MRFGTGSSLVVMAAILLSSNPAGAQVFPPTEWRLYQTDPNPFCRELHGQVTFKVDLAQPGTVVIRVWDPSHANVVRNVISLTIPGAGVMTVMWPVRDHQGLPLPDGIYPYDVRVTESSRVLFEATRTMSVTCEVATENVTWGVVKALFQ